jgi:hypothetical protein
MEEECVRPTQHQTHSIRAQGVKAMVVQVMSAGGHETTEAEEGVDGLGLDIRSYRGSDTVLFATTMEMTLINLSGEQWDGRHTHVCSTTTTERLCQHHRQYHTTPL